MSENLADFLPAQSLAKNVAKHLKMKNINHLFLIIIGLTFFCCKNIEGIYVQKYYIKQIDSIKEYVLDQNILEIKDQKFNSYNYGAKGKPSTLRYIKKGNIIKLINNENSDLTNSNTTLKKIENDSIVFVQTDGEYTIEGVYSKIPDSLKNNHKINLDKKLFVFKNEKNIDTVFFYKNFFLRKDNYNNAWDDNRCEFFNINGFDIIKIDSWNTPIYIVKERNKRLYLYSFKLSNKIFETQIIEIKHYNKQKKLEKFVQQLEEEYSI